MKQVARFQKLFFPDEAEAWVRDPGKVAQAAHEGVAIKWRFAEVHSIHSHGGS